MKTSPGQEGVYKTRDTIRDYAKTLMRDETIALSVSTSLTP